MAKELRLFTLCYPLTDGEAVSKHHLDWTCEQLSRFAGGCTVLGKSDGFWVGVGGQTVKDDILPLLTVAPDGEETEQFFHHLSAHLAALLGQDVIFVYSSPVLAA